MTEAPTIRAALGSQNDDDESESSEDEEPQTCGVCGDVAKGYHFNALTCEGCKGFFRRTIKRSVPPRCPFQNKCIITKNNRRSCQACRFQKCQAIGMCKDMVMSEMEVLERRFRIKRKKLLDAQSQLSQQQEEMIQELLSAHRSTFDATFSHVRGFRPIDRNVHLASYQSASGASDTLTDCSHSSSSSPSPSSCSPTTSFEKHENQEGGKSNCFTALPHMSDLTTYMIHDIISFSKSLQAFRSLTISDQIALLKGATFEIMMIRFNLVFNTKKSTWECGPMAYCKDDGLRAGFQAMLIDPIIKLHHTLRNLGLQDEEYVLMQAVCLFSPDRPGVQQHHLIDELHENLALTLKTWIDCKRPSTESRLLYAKVMSCLTEMRTATEEYSKQWLQIQDIQPGEIPPLIMEVFSKNDQSVSSLSHKSQTLGKHL